MKRLHSIQRHLILMDKKNDACEENVLLSFASLEDMMSLTDMILFYRTFSLVFSFVLSIQRLKSVMIVLVRERIVHSIILCTYKSRQTSDRQLCNDRLF